MRVQEPFCRRKRQCKNKFPNRDNNLNQVRFQKLKKKASHQKEKKKKTYCKVDIHYSGAINSRRQGFCTKERAKNPRSKGEYDAKKQRERIAKYDSCQQALKGERTSRKGKVIESRLEQRGKGEWL